MITSLEEACRNFSEGRKNKSHLAETRDEWMDRQKARERKIHLPWSRD